MIEPRYCNEIEALLIQFISAFDGNKIYRTDSEKKEVQIATPRWVVGNKTRVFNDLTNQAGSTTFPVVVVEPTAISLDTKRLFNKQLKQITSANNSTHRYKQPTPIEFKVTATFYTKFFSEIWQMMSNFVSVCNPYVELSWKVPQEYSNFTEELRSKATWDGSFSIDQQKGLNEDALWVVSGSTSFTIQGWIFNIPAQESGIVYAVDSYIGNSAHNIQYEAADGKFEFYRKAGWPSITNVIVENLRLYRKDSNPVNVKVGTRITIEGRSFFKHQCAGILLTNVNMPNGQILSLPYVKIITAKHGEIGGYAIMDTFVNVNDNIIKFNIPDELAGATYDVVVYNNAGYASINSEKGFLLQS